VLVARYVRERDADRKLVHGHPGIAGTTASNEHRRSIPVAEMLGTRNMWIHPAELRDGRVDGARLDVPAGLLRQRAGISPVP
jgi:hypothetical protein